VSKLDICAVIPVQQGGHDLIRNALAPFGHDNLPLIVWKIRQLKKVFSQSHIYISSHSKEIIALALQEGVKIHYREKSLEEEGKGTFGDVISSVVGNIPHEHIAWISPVIPFMGEYDYKNALSKYEKNVLTGEFDSLMAVNKVNEYFWNSKEAINYHANKVQEFRSELLPIFKVTNGLFIRSKVDILSESYYVGSNPFKFEVSKLAGLDINAQEDRDVAMELSSLFVKQQSEKNKVIFLDFDGVIFDSVIEAYAMAMLTSKKIKKLDELDIQSEHASRFISKRYLIGPAWNYYYLLKAIDNGHDNKFSDYLPSEPGAEAKDFQSAFFATRQVIRNNFWDEWLSLNQLYKGAEEFVELINRHKNIVIVTTKDADTVKALLDNYGLSRSIEIYDSKSYEQFGCKSYFIDDYIKKNNIQSSIFIDDSKKHLEKCKWVANLRLEQACWGYVEPKEYNDNKQSILDIITNELEL